MNMWQADQLVERICARQISLQKEDLADRQACGKRMWQIECLAEASRWWIKYLAEGRCGNLEQLVGGSWWRLYSML